MSLFLAMIIEKESNPICHDTQPLFFIVVINSFYRSGYFVRYVCDNV